MLLEALQRRTKVSLETLESIAASASKRYKMYTIPKRDGSPREIHHPSKTLKAVQRMLVRYMLSMAPVHESATAYEKGSSIKHNASLHAGTKFTLRMDFSDFFPSFDEGSIRSFLTQLSGKNTLSFTNDDISFAVRIFCRNGRLTIGAPSSPKVTNAMMFELDTQISEYAIANNLIYTRYADDIFISSFGSNILKDSEEYVRNIVAAHTRPKLKINENKTLHLSRGGHRSVTGLVITPMGHVSIGRDRKREIKTLTYLALKGDILEVDRARLGGLIAFANDVEPEFVASLSRKFGVDVLSAI